ncbi:MAG TPA: site-specific integrase [Actinomycetota bacterium]|nr:site-specific integrase [Actinomycetota bacterium]
MWRPEDRWIARDSLEAAFAELDRLIDERDRARLTARIEGLTISQLIDEWWSRKKREIRESTCMRYESVIRVHIRPRIGHLSANELRPLDLEDYFSSVTHKTALVSRDVLRPAFRWGMANRLVVRVDGSNPLDLAKIVRSRCLGGDAEQDANATMQVNERLIPGPREIEKLLVDAEERSEDRWWLYLRLAPTLGARPGELCALRGRDIDREACTFNISRSANKLTLTVGAVKRASSVRSLYLGPRLFEEIGPLLDEIGPDDFLFPAMGDRCGVRRIECWTANSVYGRLMRATKRLGLPPYTPHSFRHFCATHLLDEGWPAMQVARWLGHRNDIMVRLLYGAHIVEETRSQLGEAAAQLVTRPAGLRSVRPSDPHFSKVAFGGNEYQ